MYTFETFVVGSGYGFNILCDGNIIIAQEYMPDVDGFISMTEYEATRHAEIILDRVKGD